ncbi:uncharacterized protein TRIADDRAFT_62690, partial [Trichoplax adhaerens]
MKINSLSSTLSLAVFLATFYCIIDGKLHYNKEIVGAHSKHEEWISISDQHAHLTQSEDGITRLYRHTIRHQRSLPISQSSSSSSSSRSNQSLAQPQPPHVLTRVELVNNTDRQMVLRYFGKNNS